MFCPWCRSQRVKKVEQRYRCTRCRKPFSLLSGTWLSGMRLHLRTFWALLWCFTQKIPVLQANKLCHVNEKTVRHWYRQFRMHLPQFEPILSGVVQMDEAYFHSISLLMAKQVGSRTIAHRVVPKDSVDKQDACHFLFQYIEPNTKLHTDGAGIYKKIQTRWPVRHTRDIHAKFEFDHTSEIEGMFGNLRTFIRRMYHHATPKYLPEYISEFCIRFSLPEIFDSPSKYLSKTL